MWCKDWCVKMMKLIDSIDCEKCDAKIYLKRDGEHDSSYEDLKGTIPHTKLRCEVNQIVAKKFREIEVEINQLKQKLNLE